MSTAAVGEDIGVILRKNGYTVAVAESCTGGLISDKLTNVPGSSDYYLGSIVAYSNQLKIGILKVPIHMIENFGAVSPQVAKSMAQCIRHLTGASIGLGVTGIAGPGGGTIQKPVGLVYVALAMGKGVIEREFRFTGTREEIKEKTAQSALKMIKETIQQK